MLARRILLPFTFFFLLSACLSAPARPPHGSPQAISSRTPVTALSRPGAVQKTSTPSPTAISAVLTLDGAIQALAISPDGKTLAIGTQDGLVLVERTTWKVLWQSTLSQANNAVAFSPDGQTLAATSDNGRITIWDVRGATPLRVLLAASGSAGGVAFSPDGRRFAAGSFQTIQIWDTHTWVKTNTLTGHNNVVWRLVYTQDGRTLASASTDQTILLWDVARLQDKEQQKPSQILRSPTYWVRSVAFSPDGKTIAAGSGDGVVYTWDSARGKRLLTLKEEQGFIWDVAYAPADDRLAAASEDGSVVLWEANRGCMLRKWHVDSALHSLLFDPQNPTIIAGTVDGKIFLIPLP